MAKTLEEIDESIHHLVAKRQQLAKTEGRDIILQWIQPLFDEFPELLKSIWWTQYTPYFNDGDACVFSIHDVMLNWTEDNENWDKCDPWHMQWIFNATWGTKPSWYSDENWGKALESYEIERKSYEDQGWTLESVTKLEVSLKIVAGKLQQHSEFVEESFGDHVLIIALPTGEIEVKDYDHE